MIQTNNSCDNNNSDNDYGIKIDHSKNNIKMEYNTDDGDDIKSNLVKSNNPVLNDILNKLNISTKALTTPKRNFDYPNSKYSSSSSLKPESSSLTTSIKQEEDSFIDQYSYDIYFDTYNNNTSNNNYLTTTTTNNYSSRTSFEFQRLETLRRQELLKQNSHLVNLFAKTKYDYNAYDDEDDELEESEDINDNNNGDDLNNDNNDKNNKNNKIIKTFSADESIAEIEIDNFQPKFVKDIDFELLKHPNSRQFRWTSESIENDQSKIINNNNTKSNNKKSTTGKKKILAENSKTNKNRSKNYIPLNLDSKFDSVQKSSSTNESKNKSQSLPDSLNEIMVSSSKEEEKNSDGDGENISSPSKSTSLPDCSNVKKIAERLGKEYLVKKKSNNNINNKTDKDVVVVNNKLEMKIEKIIVNKKLYQVLNQIGKGGSSIVYQVYLPDTKQILALKKVNLNNADKTIVEGFRSEIRLLTRLKKCKRVVRMYDYEFINKNKELLIVMEKGDADLSQVLKSQAQLSSSKLSPHLIRLYWQEMLEAVKEIHDANVVHSDLKPVNFIWVSGTLKLIDFGIANTIQSNQTSCFKDTIIGTVDFMAPESIQKCSEHQNRIKYNQKVDIWSLGIILYNLVYGQTPFAHLGSDIFKKGMAIVNADIEYKPIDDQLLLDVIKKCLQKDPKKRPTARELLKHRYLTMHNPVNINNNNNIPTELLNHISKLSPNKLQQIAKFLSKNNVEK